MARMIQHIASQDDGFRHNFSHSCMLAHARGCGIEHLPKGNPAYTPDKSGATAKGVRFGRTGGSTGVGGEGDAGDVGCVGFRVPTQDGSVCCSGSGVGGNRMCGGVGSGGDGVVGSGVTGLGCVGGGRVSSGGEKPLNSDDLGDGTLSHRVVRSGKSSFFVSCWNCRGLASGVPYIQDLMSRGPGIMVLSEHWLWPYELDKLNSISNELDTTGKADARPYC